MVAMPDLRFNAAVYWPTQFINRLEQEFDHNRQASRRKIEDAPDLRTMFEMLPSA
jgi:hypothetical protein